MAKKDIYLEKLHLAYENDPGIQAIINVFPFLEFFKPFVSTRVKEIRSKRTETLFDELSKGKIELTQDIINSEDFIHKFFIVYRASINTRRKEKIRFFARLLKSSIINEEEIDIDIFEDYSKILQDLSFREITALTLLDSYYPNTIKVDLSRTQKFWDDYEKNLQKKININKDTIGSFMSRLSRSGCYELFTGQYFDVDASRGMGTLTSTFHEVKKFAFSED